LGVCIDYDELRTGARNEAAFTMFASFIPKVVSIPASAFPLSVLAIIGFRAPAPGGQPDLYQPLEVVWGIRVMFAFIPTSLALLSCYLKYKNFPFKDLAETDCLIKAGLLLRRDGQPFLDPLTRDYILPSQPPAAEWERAIVLLNHFPSLARVQQMRDTTLAYRGSALVMRTRCELGAAVLGTVASAAATVGTMAMGIFSNKTLNWIPSLLVIATGLCILVSIITYLRLRAAKALRNTELPDDLLDYVIQERSLARRDTLEEGAVERHRDMAEAVQQALSNLKTLFATMNPAGGNQERYLLANEG
jgi:hypothetical protein